MAMSRFDELLAAQEHEPRRLAHPEHDIQVACFAWFNMVYSQYRGLLFAVPNGAMLNGSAKQRMLAGKRLKAEGMVKGVADLLLLVPNGVYHGLCIEIKTASGSQSAEQREWQAKVEGQGYLYKVVKPRKGVDGFDVFRDVIDDYLTNV